MSNYIEFFRFNGQYEDVFIEDDHYLYVQAEPFNWAHLFVSHTYQDNGYGGWIIGDTVGSDVEYLESLEPADEEIAKQIIDNEHERFNEWHDENYESDDY